MTSQLQSGKTLIKPLFQLRFWTGLQSLKFFLILLRSTVLTVINCKIPRFTLDNLLNFFWFHNGISNVPISFVGYRLTTTNYMKRSCLIVMKQSRRARFCSESIVMWWNLNGQGYKRVTWPKLRFWLLDWLKLGWCLHILSLEVFITFSPI